MTISGGIKVFEKSSSLFKDSGNATASTGNGAADSILSMNRYLRWDSVGSDDTTAETITITFDSTTIDRIFIVDHNLKDFSITYGSGASSFANVVGIDGALGGGIVETAFAQDTAYYEFDQVTTDQINITATKTQTVDAEKYITIFVTTNELGTFEGYPNVRPQVDANEKREQVQSGKFITQKNFESFAAQLSIEHSVQADVTLVDTMYESQDPFLIWLCGGKYGSSNFSVNFKNWRLKDLYQVQTFNDMKTTFRDNSYVGSPITSIRMAEEV